MKKSPWSIKGIDPDARELAKEAAAKEGLTLGQWLTKKIEESSHDEEIEQSDLGHAEDASMASESSGVIPNVEADNSTNELNEVSAPQSSAKTNTITAGSANDDAAMVNLSDALASERLDEELDGIASKLVTIGEEVNNHAGFTDLSKNISVSDKQAESKVPSHELEKIAEGVIEASKELDARNLSTDDLLARIEAFERRYDAQIDKVEQQVSKIQTTNEESSQGKTIDGNLDKLEGAVNAVVDHIALTDRRTSQLLHVMQDRISGMAEKVAKLPAQEQYKDIFESSVSELTEKFNDISAVVSAVSKINENRDHQDAQLQQSIENKHSEVEGYVVDLSQQIEQLEAKISDLSSVDTYTQAIAEHPVVRALDQRLMDMNNRLSQRSEVIPTSIRSLEEKISRIERGNAGLDQDSIDRRLGALASMVDDQVQLGESRAAEAEDKMADLSAEVSSLRDKLPRNFNENSEELMQENIDDLSQQIAEIRADIHSADIGSQTEKISELQAEVQSIIEGKNSLSNIDDSELDLLSSRVDIAENSINEILISWDSVADHVAEIDNQINSLVEGSAQRVRYEEFERVVNRLDALDDQLKAGQFAGQENSAYENQFDDIREMLAYKANQSDLSDMKDQLASVAEFVEIVDQKVGTNSDGIGHNHTIEERITDLASRFNEILPMVGNIEDLEELRNRVEATVDAFDSLAEQPDTVAYFAHQMNDLTHRVKSAEARYANVDSLEQTVGQLFDHITDVKRQAGVAADRASDKAVAKIVSQISTSELDGGQLKISAPSSEEIAELLTENEQRNAAALNRLQDSVQDIASQNYDTKTTLDANVSELRNMISEISNKLQQTYDRAEALERVAIARGSINSTEYNKGFELKETAYNESSATSNGYSAQLDESVDQLMPDIKSGNYMGNAEMNKLRKSLSGLSAVNDDSWRWGAGVAAAMSFIAMGIAWQAGLFTGDSQPKEIEVATATQQVTQVPSRNNIAIAESEILNNNVPSVDEAIIDQRIVASVNDDLGLDNFGIEDGVNIITSSTSIPADLDTQGGGGLGILPDINALDLTSWLPEEKVGPLGLRVAAALNDPNAAYLVGIAYLDGKGVAQNSDLAAKWLTKSAENSYALAQFRLALMYDQGLGVAEDKSKSRDLNLQSAQGGNLRAMHNYAVMLASGIGGQRNMSDAARWFEKAANYGLTVSQFNLGVLYDRGVGVRKDPGEALKWYTLASLQGDKEAGIRANNVRRRVTTAENEIVTREIKAFKTRNVLVSANEVREPVHGWDNYAFNEGGSSLSKAELVRKVQASLSKLGYNPGKFDGVVGTQTSIALRNFVSDSGIGNQQEITPALVSLLTEVVRREKL